MKNKFMLGVLFAGMTGLFAACADDNDSNPTLIQPTGFELNTPAYVNETVDLAGTESLRLTWSQPVYTVENAPINAVYEVQVSLTDSYTISTAEAEADEEGALVADYAAIDKTSTTCATDLATSELNTALMKIAKWTADDVPAEQTVYVRVNAFVQEGTERLNAVTSNSVALKVAPYYVELSDAAPIMFYIVGNNIGDASWSQSYGVGTFPMFLQSGYAYDKTTGAGEITYLNYFDDNGWKLQPADWNWDYGFMSGGSANTAVYRNGDGDGGNIWCSPAGYYRVTINTGTNECTITPQEITPAVYDQICITGSFNEWADADMTPVNMTGENHVWCYTMTVAEDVVEQIKFKIPANWDTNWGYGTYDGEVSTCGKGTSGGCNIGVPAGSWIIMFNDIDGTFSIIAQ